MNSALIVALVCQVSNFNNPVMFKADINGPLKNKKYALKLEENYYGYLTVYNITLTKNADGTFSGKDKYGESVVVRDLVKTKKETTLVIDHSKEGQIEMTCSNK